MGAALTWTLPDVLVEVLADLPEDVFGDVFAVVFVGISGFKFLPGIKVVAVEATLVPSLSVAGMDASKSRRAVPIPCRLRVSVNTCGDAASPVRRLPLSRPTSASLRLSWNELAAICAVPRDLPSVPMGESSDRFVSSVVIKMASASALANARCPPNPLLFQCMGGLGYNELDMNRDFLSGWLNP
jgi:hypothetical protein